jgi:response regulator RpfG family c-di-GMP phosphodiesterase
MAAHEDNEILVFSDEETPAAASASAGPPWRILIADDDNEVHKISSTVLRDLVFDGRPLQLLSAHSGAAALDLMARHDDVALLLLDVVMETDTAGLDVVRRVREELGNQFVRIVLRTGQPGQAPEKAVVVDYDINDYKEKTELTAQRLVTTVLSSLRAYRDIRTIERGRRGLEQVIEASRSLFKPQSLAQFCEGVLRQLAALLHAGEDSLYMRAAGFAAYRDRARGSGDFRILAATGRFENGVGRPVADVVAPDLMIRMLTALTRQELQVESEDVFGAFRTSLGSDNLIYMHGCTAPGPMESRLLQAFSANLAVAFDNLYLNQELLDTQTELINRLGEVMETRSAETGYHVVRVGEFSHLLASLIGLPERERDVLRLAAPLHDLGKVGVPDALLNKPGRLTAEEFELMKSHTEIGFRILQGSRHAALQAAAITAHQHHEWWDGTGYPQKLRGEDIHVFGRIVALADVFDALAHSRCYKEAWNLDSVLEHIKARRGTQFDPRLVDALFDNLDAFLAILEAYPD